MNQETWGDASLNRFNRWHLRVSLKKTRNFCSVFASWAVEILLALALRISYVTVALARFSSISGMLMTKTLLPVLSQTIRPGRSVFGRGKFSKRV